MSIEVEKKYRLEKDEFEQTENELKKIGAEYIGEDSEENILFQGGILSETGAVLRVRKIKGKTLLTYKQRIKPESSIKHQIEFETEIGNAEQIENIIDKLGFHKTLVYEKRRKIWRFNEVEIVLDELPFGLFMEIEGESKKIIEMEKAINAQSYKTEPETYPELTAKFGKKNGQIIEARFESQ